MAIFRVDIEATEQTLNDMTDRNNIQLAIGYGLGTGMALAGLFVTVGTFVLSWLDLGIRVYVLGTVIVLGGIVIAVVNALKLDRTTVSKAEDRSE